MSAFLGSPFESEQCITVPFAGIEFRNHGKERCFRFQAQLLPDRLDVISRHAIRMAALKIDSTSWHITDAACRDDAISYGGLFVGSIDNYQVICPFTCKLL